ncbi:hypothetical protein F7725_002752 [Dissostichus mawsoni]|uniref:Secreted protein n=1 Tax=Dissostichus mawsoni TaxID=36200 RepID=A0A7J5Y891_DISMA|nr:hypothetical protein F7725_002752 [Dissostichus mawsoni]
MVCLLGGGGVSLCVLVSLQQQVDQSWNSTCLPQRRLIGRAQGQVPDQTNSCLRGETDQNLSQQDTLSLVRLPQQLHDRWDAVVQPHSILGQLCVLVAGGEVAQGTDGRLSNILLLPGTQHGIAERPQTVLDQTLTGAYKSCRQSVVMARNLGLLFFSNGTILCRPSARRTAILAPSWCSSRLWRVVMA